MLKWLVNVTGQEGEISNDDIQNKITDDPLATIKISGKSKPKKVYSVNRFNPLYEEERPDKGITKDVATHGDDDQETVSTTSSGYGSNTPQKEPPGPGSDAKVIVKVTPETDIPSPVWPEVRIANTGDHVTRIQLDTEEQGQEQTRHDSIVTHSLLMMMGSDSLDSAASSSCVIRNNTVTVNTSDQARYSDPRNKHHVTKAIKDVRRSFRNVRGSLRKSSRKIVRRGKVRPGTQSGSLRSGGSVEAVRELWSKTGMRTNGGRKLLLEASSSEAEAGHERVNPGYESDVSEVSGPRWGTIITPGARTRRQESTSSSGSSGSLSGEKKLKAQKYNKRPRRPDNNSVTFDSIQVEKVENVFREPAKVRFNNYHKYNTERRGIMQEKNMLWDRYYGTANPGLIEAASNTMASNFTLDLEKNKSLRKQEKRRKNLRWCCKISCFLILLISFLLVIITVTFFLTKGKKYFGAL